MSDAAQEIPGHLELMWPTVQALRDLGGSATNSEISSGVVHREGFTEKQQDIRRKPGHRMSLIDYRLAWARSALKLAGYLESSARGVWALTSAGRTVTDRDEVMKVAKEAKAEYNRLYAENKRKHAATDPDDPDSAVEDSIDPEWTDVLLDRLIQVSPSGFERLTQRLLREAGFRDVQVLGRAGDGGIDGVGTLRVSLVSFPIYFQCKRYQGSVGPSAVRDFRGAMAGHGDKGLLITTGTFTQAAEAEATKAGAPPIDLMSGLELAQRLKEYSLGVSTRQVEEVSVDLEFFDQYDD